MGPTPDRTPVALFVALVRAVRDAPLAPDARQRGFDAIERMGAAIGRPRFAVELEAFIAFASGEPRLHATLQPFWAELRALAAVSSDTSVVLPKRR